MSIKEKDAELLLHVWGSSKRGEVEAEVGYPSVSVDYNSGPEWGMEAARLEKEAIDLMLSRHLLSASTRNALEERVRVLCALLKTEPIVHEGDSETTRAVMGRMRETHPDKHREALQHYRDLKWLEIGPLHQIRLLFVRLWAEHVSEEAA